MGIERDDELYTTLRCAQATNRQRGRSTAAISLGKLVPFGGAAVCARAARAGGRWRRDGEEDSVRRHNTSRLPNHAPHCEPDPS